MNAAFVSSGAGSSFSLAIFQGDFEAVEDLGDAEGYHHGGGHTCERERPERRFSRDLSLFLTCQRFGFARARSGYPSLR